METVAQAVLAKNEPTAAGYFECRMPETNLRIRISLAVIERLATDAMEGFKKVPKRGLEIGGVLLGRVEQDGAIVDDFEALDSEHQRGPSYLLSEKDKGLLGAAVARWNTDDTRRVVGLFRSHTRAAVGPGEEDEALMKEHCPAPAAVLLLVKPEAGGRCRAALYATGDGLHAKPVEFPFHHGALVSGGYTAVEAPGPRVEPAPPPECASPATARAEHMPRLRGAKLMEAMTQQLEQARQSQPREVPMPGPRGGRRGGTIALGVCVVLFGGVASYGAARWWTRAPAAKLASPPKSLALSVTWGRDTLRLSWDREAGLIRNASRGVVGIADGGKKQRLELTPQELKEGSITYWPTSNDVSFKLEAFNSQGSTSESVRAVGIPLPEPPVSKPAKAEGAVEKSAAPDRARPSPGNQAFAKVSMEMVRESTWQRLWGKAPITTPPKLLHSVIPTARALRQYLKDQVTIDVKLSLDATGTVKRSEVVRRADVPAHLADLALNASRRWTFAPARVGQRRVGSEVVLHYQFGDPLLADARLP